MSYDIQGNLSLIVERSVYIHSNLDDKALNSLVADPPYGIYLQQFNASSASALLSNVKIKRPDGTWASVLQVTEVHLRLPDGTWQIFT